MTAVAVITSLLAALPLSEPSIQQHNVLNLDMSSLHDALLMFFVWKAGLISALSLTEKCAQTPSTMAGLELVILLGHVLLHSASAAQHDLNTISVACSDESQISPEIRPPEEFIDPTAYRPPASPARPARLEPTTHRFAAAMSVSDCTFGALSSVPVTV